MSTSLRLSNMILTVLFQPFSLFPKTWELFGFQIFVFQRTWWRLFKRSVVCTKFDYQRTDICNMISIVHRLNWHSREYIKKDNSNILRLHDKQMNKQHKRWNKFNHFKTTTLHKKSLLMILFQQYLISMVIFNETKINNTHWW